MIAPLPKWGEQRQPTSQFDGRTICPECQRKPVEAGGDTCFRCRVATVGYTWHGGGHNFGRSNFSARTNAEFVAEHVGDNPNAAHMGSGEWQG